MKVIMNCSCKINICLCLSTTLCKKTAAVTENAPFVLVSVVCLKYTPLRELRKHFRIHYVKEHGCLANPIWFLKSLQVFILYVLEQSFQNYYYCCPITSIPQILRTYIKKKLM